MPSASPRHPPNAHPAAQTVETADLNGSGGRSSSPDHDRVKAVAAKISAARELARRLAEEKQTAATVIKTASQGEAERCGSLAAGLIVL